MTRGELWWADFGVPSGSEPGYKRPVITLQRIQINNDNNYGKNILQRENLLAE